jgi:hypothetical protein
MISKITSILGSVRFWQLLIGALLLILASYGIIPQEIANVIAGLLGVSVTIGTVDKATK